MRVAAWAIASALAHAGLAAAFLLRWPASAPPAPGPAAVQVVMVEEAAQPPGATAPAQAAPQEGEGAPRPAPAAPRVSLGAQESDPWHVLSDDIRPPAPDARYRNLPPRYPYDAVARGEAGAVAIVVHVLADGTAGGADIVESSGSPRLDREARRAVLLWHFEPALRAGLPVAFDYPISINFTRDH